MHHRMCPGFQSHQNQCQNCQSRLQTLVAFFFCREISAPPLRRRSGAEFPSPRKNGKIHKRAKSGKNQHRNANGVLMKAASRGVDAAGCGQRREANGYADAAEGQHRRAGALQESYQEASAVQRSQAFAIDDFLALQSALFAGADQE